MNPLIAIVNGAICKCAAEFRSNNHKQSHAKCRESCDEPTSGVNGDFTTCHCLQKRGLRAILLDRLVKD